MHLWFLFLIYVFISFISFFDRTLHLNLGLSMLAPHKTSAVYVHVTGDMGAPENYAESVEYYLDAFSLTRFRWA